MSFSARKMHSFDKNGLLTPAGARLSGDVKELFFWGVFYYLNPEGFYWAMGKVGHMVKPPSEHIPFSNRPFLYDLKKKNSISNK